MTFNFFSSFLVLALSLSFSLNTAMAQHKTPETTKAPTVVISADTGKLDVITMQDGKRISGKIVAIDAEKVTIKPIDGGETMQLNRSMVVSISSMLRKDIDNTPHLGAHCLLLNQTAFMLPKGRGVYENLDVFLSNRVDFGITDNFTAGVGIDVILLRAHVKVGGQIAKNVHAGLSVVGASAPIFSVSSNRNNNFSSSSGLWYVNALGVFTFGTPETFLNAGAGVTYADVFGLGNSVPVPTVTLGGFTRVSKRWGIMTDNSLFPGREIALNNYYGGTQQSSLFTGTAGARYLAKNLSLDFGLSIYSVYSRTTYAITNPYSSNNETTSGLVLPYFGLKVHW